MKKFAGALATILLTTSLATVAIAAPPDQSVNLEPRKSHQANFDQKEHFKHHQCGVRSIIKESLQRNNKDLTKVKADVDKYYAQKLVLREAHLAKIAKGKGISTEELKSRIAAKRQERLTNKAKELGITTGELKKMMQAKHQQKMEAMAKDLGLSLAQLQQILPANPMKKF